MSESAALMSPEIEGSNRINFSVLSYDPVSDTNFVILVIKTEVVGFGFSVESGSVSEEVLFFISVSVLNLVALGAPVSVSISNSKIDLVYGASVSVSMVDLVSLGASVSVSMVDLVALRDSVSKEVWFFISIPPMSLGVVEGGSSLVVSSDSITSKKNLNFLLKLLSTESVLERK